MQRREGDALREAYASPEHHEAVKAFLEEARARLLDSSPGPRGEAMKTLDTILYDPETRDAQDTRLLLTVNLEEPVRRLGRWGKAGR